MLKVGLNVLGSMLRLQSSRLVEEEYFKEMRGITTRMIPWGFPHARMSRRLAQMYSGRGIKIKRALDFLQWPPFNRVRVNHRRPDVTMPQQFLDRPDIIACLQQMAGKTMAECMRGYAFA